MQTLKDNGGSGLIAICTGGGKSKIAIDYMKELYEENNNLKVLLVVPTEKLRDENWKTEFNDWDASNLYHSNLIRSCYVSISKIENEFFDLVILDEAHRITEANKVFFDKNQVNKILALTATPPKDEEKIKILNELNLPIVYELSLDEGVELGIVAPYKIKVIQSVLDNKLKYIESGSKKNRFYVTEEAQYKYLSRQIQKLMYSGEDIPKFLFLNRMRFIYNLKSKTELAKKIINSLPKEEKTLIFCGSIQQANELCEHNFHSKTDGKDLDKFMKDEIKMLSCVNALNEGMNIQNIDNAIVVQLDSVDLNLIQRIGRACRFRENHLANIYILCATGTQDEKWVETALKSFDKNNIEYVYYKNL